METIGFVICNCFAFIELFIRLAVGTLQIEEYNFSNFRNTITK